MARLDWRPVAAPDFSPVAQSYGTAARLLDGAFTGLGNALEGFDRSRDEAVSRDVLARALAIQDPTKYTSALPELAQLAGNRLTPELMRDLQAGIGVRGENAISDLRRQTVASDLTYNTRVRADDVLDRDSLNAAKPILNQITAAELKGDQATATRLRSENADLLGKLSTTDYRSSARTGQELMAGNQGLATGALGLERGRWNFSNEVSDRAEARQAEQLMDTLARTNIDAASAEAALNQMEGVPAVVRNAVRGRLGSAFRVDDYLAAATGGAGPTAGGAGIEGPAGGWAGGAPDGSRVMNYTARGVGVNMVPDSVKTLGDASTFARQVNRQGASSSAMGLFQITGDTLRDFGPRVFGADWQNVAYGPEAEDKLGKAIFEASKGSARSLAGRWTSLTVQEAEQVRRLPWEQARNIIAQGESGARLPPVLGSAQMTQANTLAASEGRAIGTQASSGRDFSMASGYVAAQQSAGMPIEQVLNTYTAEGGLLAGKDKGTLRTEVQNLSRRYQVAPAVAAWAIAESQRNSASFGSVVGRLATGKGEFAPQRTNLGDASYWLEWAKNGAGADSINLATQQGQVMQNLPALQAARDQAKAAYDQAVRAAARTGGNINLRPYEAAVNEAEANLRLANAGAMQSPVVRQNQQPARPVAPAAIARSMAPVNRPTQSRASNSGIDRILNFRMP